MTFRIIDGGKRPEAEVAAEQERAAILDRVAMGIWQDSDEGGPTVNWSDAQHLPELRDIVEWTRRAARVALVALVIGEHPSAGDMRMAMAGEHVSGLLPHDCMATFDAMIAEVLTK